MSWMKNIQVRDLDATQRIEMTCRSCGHVHYLSKAMICVSPEREFLYLDEVERETVCRQRGCRGGVRLSLSQGRTASGFVGGLA